MFTRKELNQVIIDVVNRVLNIFNGYCPEDYVIVENHNELEFYRESEPYDDGAVVYRINAEGLNSQIDPVIEQVEELCELGDIEQLKQLAREIAECYVSCDDDYYSTVGYISEEDVLRECEAYL